jgi:hypothetical protein
MAVEMRELYSSPNGDRWYLARDVDLGQVFIRHEPNLPSGGQTARIEVGAFLGRGQGPEHRELLRLIGTLVERDHSFERGAAARIKSHAKSPHCGADRRLTMAHLARGPSHNTRVDA